MKMAVVYFFFFLIPFIYQLFMIKLEFNDDPAEKLKNPEQYEKQL